MDSEIAETLSISAVENTQTADYCKTTEPYILYKRRCGCPILRIIQSRAG